MLISISKRGEKGANQRWNKTRKKKGERNKNLQRSATRRHASGEEGKGRKEQEKNRKKGEGRGGKQSHKPERRRRGHIRPSGERALSRGGQCVGDDGSGRNRDST